MQFFWPFLISTIAGLSTIIGSIIINIKWQKKDAINKFIVFCLSLSLSIMIGISITELIPEASYTILTEFKLIKGIFLMFPIFLLGIIIVLIISKKITNTQNDLYKVGILSMVALMLHNLPEGIITFLSSMQNINLGLKLSFAIMMHNIPEGISIAVPIYYATNDKKKAFKMTFLSGLAEPLGALLAYLFLSKYLTDTLIAFILIFVAGIMITLSIHELLPKAKKYQNDLWIIIGILSGIGLLIINTLIA